MSLLDVVAILGVRNEEVCLGNALRHLKASGIRYAVIDNGSDDDTTAIIRREEFSSHLVAMRNLPYRGVHDLEGMLLAEDLEHHVSAELEDQLHRERERFYLAAEAASIDSKPHQVSLYFDASAYLATNTPEQRVGERVPGRARRPRGGPTTPRTRSPSR